MKTQYDRIAKLLTRKRGCTPMEIVQAVGSVCPHRRLKDMRDKGWTITRRQVAGKSYGTYHGVAPR
jgi:hypothetical protein